ncbi:ribose 1,5-bisphosphate phosphokinase PhnN [Betaproteobacteria bacterium]|nr:ribose 1,5-bisphosphate phosphokinase PhnN [Betaproteobacteria bacterium]
MQGALIYLMGPSGAGKDSLLTALRQSDAKNLLIAHRYITRPVNHRDAEQHVFLSETEFHARRERSLFALDWQAHGEAYAIGTEVDNWLQYGFWVVVNGSRAYLPTARAKYGQRLLPVCLLVTPKTLEKRLVARGRENAEQIAQRLERAGKYQDNLPDDCLFLHNETDIEDAAKRFLQLMQDILGEQLSTSLRFSRSSWHPEIAYSGL